MWIFTKDGFFSAVEHKDDPKKVVVRARTELDIRALAKWLKTTPYKSRKGADYPFRLFCSKKEWAEYVKSSALDIDYSNFKDAMHTRFGSNRIRQLHEVWAVMAGWYGYEEDYYAQTYDYEQTQKGQGNSLRRLWQNN